MLRSSALGSGPIINLTVDLLGFMGGGWAFFGAKAPKNGDVFSGTKIQ